MSVKAEYITRYKGDGIWCGAFTHFPDFVVQGVSTRLGGYSEGDNLNLALHTGDNPEAVIANRRKFCHSLGLEDTMIVTPEQVHGDRIVCVTKTDCTRGAWEYSDSIPQCDGLITNQPDVALMLCYADCVPLLFVDPIHRAIGVSHAGWKGTAKKIGVKTLRAMHEQFGTQAEECLVGVGPSIGACCYEVDDYVLGEFRKEYANTNPFFHPTDIIGKYHLDLWLANRLALEEAGVLSDNIVSADVCTACNHRLLFSYRAEHGKTGRIAALLSIQE